MGLIRLRAVPADLHRRLKAEAATAGVTLEVWCVSRLEEKHGGSEGKAEPAGTGAEEEPAREAHDRDELALLVQQKDALSVANQTLREALEKVEWIMVNDTQAGKGRS